MNDLRLFLIVLGILVIVGIYIWGTLQSRKKQRQQTISEPTPLNDIADMKIASMPDREIDYSSALAGLNQSITVSRQDTVNTASSDINTQQGDLLQNDNSVQDRPGTDSDVRHPSESGIESSQGSEESTNANERIITLHIIPRANKMLDGMLILNTMEELDMTLGEMQIFHHFGIGDMKMNRPLFSIANMVEPGGFDIEAMENFTTPGLVMFMCIPAVIDAQVVFELMLNTAQRMADMLSADVCDENRALINEQKIESIRSSIIT